MPSARANGGFNTQSRFSSYASVEWAEDDAWDSGSDSDSGTKKTVSMSNAANSIKIPFESAIGFELTGDLEPGLDKKDADAADASDQNVAWKKGYETADAKVT